MLRLLISLLLLGLAAVASADQRSTVTRQLRDAHRDIGALKRQVAEMGQEKSALYGELRKTDKGLAGLQQDIDQVKQQLQSSQQQLTQLRARKEQLVKESLKQEQIIAKQARAAYLSGAGQEYLKLLLNQEDPQSFSRTLTYYEYLSKARFAQVLAYKQTLRELATTEQGIELQNEQLLENQQRLAQQRQQLAKVKHEQKQALSKLNSKLAAHDLRLKARQQEQAKLDQLLQTIEQARRAEEAQRRRAQAEAAAKAKVEAETKAQAGAPGKPSSPTAPAAPQAPQVSPAPVAPALPTAPNGGNAFAAAQGHLPWPIKGHLVARFGQPRGDDPRSTWDGVLIGAPPGTQVRAVSAGRVVFADWLRGLGLIIILDHGDGYLSLYGHAQQLLKNVGEQVAAGEAIATVGNSGGQSMTALYFAIRQQGRAQDPLRWCRGQG